MCPLIETGLAPARIVLDNGATLLVKPTRATPAVTIDVAVRAGSAADPPGGPGAMFLLSRTIDRGTATRSAEQVAEEFDSRGISLTVAVTRHVTSLVCTCLAEDFEQVLMLVGDVLVSPSF